MNKLDNLNSWKIFLSLANTKNFQATADFFESDLSTISRTVDSLEKALGLKLIVRKKRPLQLTPAGMKAQKLMGDLVGHHQQIIAELQSDNSLLEGEIKVSVAQGLSLQMINLISEFQRYHTKVTFKMVGHGAVSDVEKNIADIACVTGNSASEEIFLIPRAHVSYAAIASPDYLEKKPVPADPRYLKNHVIYQYDGENRTSPNLLIKGKESFPISGENILQSSDILTIKNAVLHGSGICLDMPLPLCKQELDQGKLVRIFPGWHIETQSTFIAIHRNLLTSRRHRIFAYWLKDKLAELDC